MSKSLLTLEELLSATKGTQIGHNSVEFLSVETDSRNITVDSKVMFVPLVGEFQDGHKYVEQAISSGATVVLINNSEYKKNSKKYDDIVSSTRVCIICVENTLYGLQKAAEAYVAKTASKMIRVSITGSCGKTTTKELLVSVCKAHFGEENVAYTKGNFNSETGLPLSVFKIRGDEKIGIFEMGMNRVNEIGEISAVLISKYGIITNIGTAHIGILGSRQNIALEKRKSFDYIPVDGAAFVPVDDDFADFCTEKVKGKVVKFGSSIKENENGVKFISDNGLYGSTFMLDGVEINLPLSGAYNYENALGVIALAKELGISAETIKKGIENSSAVSGRMEIKKTKLKNNGEITLVKDCYNANPDSMLKSIEFVAGLKEKAKKIMILADMKELGEKSKEAHENIGLALCNCKPDKVILVGSEMAACKKILDNNGLNCTSFDESNENNFKIIADMLNDYCSTNDIVLLKGSNSMKLADILPFCTVEGRKN